MVSTNQVAALAGQIGEPARAAMLVALMDGRALTARELAEVAGVTPQTASGHLAQLAAARLLTLERQGRHRYHRLASPEVGWLLEQLMRLASPGGDGQRAVPKVVGPRDRALRRARTCYDHLAGRFAVGIADGLLARRAIVLEDGAGMITDSGMAMLGELGITVPDGVGPRPTRPLCRPCLDWSERRHHLAGALGASICTASLRQGWVRRLEGTRALAVTRKGERVLREVFGVALDP